MQNASAVHLALLYRLSQTFNSSLDLTLVLEHVMDEVIAATQAERGFVMLREPDGKLAFRTARGLDHRTIESPEFQISRSVVERVAAEGKPRLSSDAQTEAWLSSRDSVSLLGLRSILCVPIQFKGITQGVIYVDNRLQAGLFTQDALDLLSAIASTAAIAIENARLYQVAVEKGRMERELQVAREVQTSLLPRETPQLAGWEFATLWRSAHPVSGDFYDFITARAGGPAFVIGDVSDKGMPAALFMAVARSILRASAAAADTPAQCIDHANRLLCQDASRGMFVTLVYAEIDPGHNQVTFVNAGHNPPLLYRASEAKLQELERTGLALGIEEETEFKQRTVTLQPGDSILLYTDGVTEATNAAQQEWGVLRLSQLVVENGHASAKELVALLEADLRRFIDSAPQSDDMTIVAAKRTG